MRVRAGIVGGTGYTAGELLALLLHHPQVEVAWVLSRSEAGRPVAEVHDALVGLTELAFCESVPVEAVDVVFLCLPHGAARPFLEQQQLPASAKIIDLSRDHRLEDSADGFVYGLPEWQADRIAAADRVANPGCFATALQLALLPLARAGLLTDEVHVHALTGATGAGRSLSATTHFAWRTANVSVYKPFRHQHMDEVRQTLQAAQRKALPPIHFVPMRGPWARGIFASLYTRTERTAEELHALYDAAFAEAPFTLRSDRPIALKQVVQTNRCLIHVMRQGEMAHITCAIDNLLKGASGQAVENMNLMFGFERTAGLRLKPGVF